MKTRKTMAFAILILTLTLTQSFFAFANTKGVHGHLDSIMGNMISGWMWDSEAQEEVQEVTLTITNNATKEEVAVLSASASEYREDLKNSGYGTGNYGFHAAMDWSSLPDGIYSITASAKGTLLPQVMTKVQGDIPDPARNRRVEYLGNFVTTGYCPCYQCSEGWGRMTSSGALATSRHTVAVDPRVIPIGTHLIIDGQEYVAEDIGGGVRGKHIDIYFDTHAETRTHGKRHQDVYVIR